MARKSEVEQLSGQIYVALIAHHLDDYAVDDKGTDWEAMAQTAVMAALTLAEEWKYLLEVECVNESA